MRRTGVLIWILWMGLFGFTSCTDRLEEVEEQYTGENEVWVRLIVSRPYSGKEVRSKAGNDRETEIDEIQLLVFEEVRKKASGRGASDGFRKETP